MNDHAKHLAAAAALLGLLAVGAAMPVYAVGPSTVLAPAITLPWTPVAVESIEPGDYAATMTYGTTQQLSPTVLPEKAASRNTVSYLSDNSNIVTVSETGVVQAVGLGTANITATAGEMSITYTITVEPDESMIVKEMDLTLQSQTIYVGEYTQVSLAVSPSTASSYASVTLSSSDESVATVNNFGKVTGVAAGKATITATCGDVTASATITVVNIPASSVASSIVVQSLTLNTNYIVLKPGTSTTITGSVSPSSAKQSLTFKSQDTNVATVSSKGIVTGISTGATSIIVSNGTISASVAVIVNRNASSTGANSEETGGETTDPTAQDPVVQAIQAAEGSEVTLRQSEVPLITSAMLTALGSSDKTLVVEADGYTLRLAGSDIKDTAAEVNTALTFADSEYGQTFTLNEGGSLPGNVQVTLTGENASYTRLYLYNAVSEKWQLLNTYENGTITANTAGEYLLTNQNLRFTNINWTFFIAGGVVVIACVIAYIVVKKRYWFW